jgi:hypothetical protein
MTHETRGCEDDNVTEIHPSRNAVPLARRKLPDSFVDGIQQLTGSRQVRLQLANVLIPNLKFLLMSLSCLQQLLPESGDLLAQGEGFRYSRFVFCEPGASSVKLFPQLGDFR